MGGWEGVTWWVGAGGPGVCMRGRVIGVGGGGGETGGLGWCFCYNPGGLDAGRLIIGPSDG